MERNALLLKKKDEISVWLHLNNSPNSKQSLFKYKITKLFFYSEDINSMRNKQCLGLNLISKRIQPFIQQE